MANSNSAKSLFEQNIKGARECITLYQGISRLGVSLDTSWLLRASVVFSISALDAYFHDKIYYRAGKLNLHDMPPKAAQFKISLSELTVWEEKDRKGNVIRNWIGDHFSRLPLQRKDDISQALRIVGIESLWATIEPNSPKREAWLKTFEGYVGRRNEIAHEGDRLKSRKSGKRLRPIDEAYAQQCADFAKDMVAKIEAAFPK